MNTTEKETMKVSKALNYLGKAYLKMPRVVLDSLFSKNKNEQMKGKVHYALFANCFYSDGYVDVNGRQIPCREGELITTYEHLASLVHLSVRTTCNLVKELVAKSLVDVQHMAGRTCFTVCGYKEFMHASALPDNRPVRKDSHGVQDTDRRQIEIEQLISRGHTSRTDLLNY